MCTILLVRVIMNWTTHIVSPKKLRDPNCTMSMRKKYIAVLPSRRPPPCLPSMPTHMQASTCHRQRWICPAGWTVPIVPSLHRHCCTFLSTQCAIIVILLVINIFFSSFNDVDPSHMMLVDCCMLCCRRCGPIAAVWQRRLPWSIKFDCILPNFT